MKGKFTLLRKIDIPNCLVTACLIKLIIAAIFTESIKPYGNKAAFSGIILCKIH